jgi:hypothetical protein
LPTLLKLRCTIANVTLIKDVSYCEPTAGKTRYSKKVGSMGFIIRSIVVVIGFIFTIICHSIPGFILGAIVSFPLCMIILPALGVPLKIAGIIASILTYTIMGLWVVVKILENW